MTSDGTLVRQTVVFEENFDCVNVVLSVFCIFKYVFDILVFEKLFKEYLVFSISNTL